MDRAIRIDHVSKQFKLYQEQYSSLKERAIHFGHNPYEEFWALRDIDLEVGEGETLGLIGRNGSGKSTLLKCVAGILKPTAGEIRTRGRLAALLELGAGFHPDLSGRENVFLNAALLGLARKEVAEKFDEIVAFAELEEHIDQQVKFYSSGMYVRLGFAVAVNLEPDILLVDEVLAVGDELFQKKCLERVKRFQREGRTIVFVTHSVDLVRQICDRVAVLDKGEMVALGPPGEAVRSFREHLLRHQRHEEAAGLGGDGVVDESGDPRDQSAIRITHLNFGHPESDKPTHIGSGEPLSVHMGYQTREPVDDIVAGIAIYDHDGHVLFGTNSDLLDVAVGPLEGAGEFVFTLTAVPLLEGTYPIVVSLHTHGGAHMYDWRDHQDWFEVVSPSNAVGSLQIPVQMSVVTEPPAEAIAG